MAAAERVPPAAGRMAGVVLASAAALAALVFLRFVRDGLTGQRRFTAPLDIVLYYVVPAALAVLLFASLRLTAIQRLRVLASAVAFAAALYAANAALVLVDGSPLKAGPLVEGQLKPVMATLARASNREQYAADLSARFHRPIDARTPAEVIAALRQRGADAERIITATNQLFLTRPDGAVESAIKIDGLEVVPLASVSHKMTLLCNENGDWVTFESDRHGFNNPDHLWDSARPTIAALGDSFTQGYCVPPGESFVDRIRSRRPDTLNLGVSGDGPLMELATLQEFLPRLAPKTVLWFYFEGNDLTDLQVERRNAVLMRYLSAGFVQPALDGQAEIDRAMLAEVPRLVGIEAENWRSNRWQTLNSGLIAFAKLTAIRDRLSPIAATDPATARAAVDFEITNLDVFRTILVEARNRVAAWDGRLVFVYLPEWSRYTTYTSLGIAKRGVVLQTVRALGIPVIDLDPVFQATGDPLSLFPFRQVGHYADAGHRLVADEVLRRLSESERHN